MAGPGPQLKGIRVNQYLLDESPVHSSWCQDTPGVPAIVSTFLQQDGRREGEKADPELEPVTRLCSSMAIFLPCERPEYTFQLRACITPLLTWVLLTEAELGCGQQTHLHFSCGDKVSLTDLRHPAVICTNHSLASHTPYFSI